MESTFVQAATFQHLRPFFADDEINKFMSDPRLTSIKLTPYCQLLCANSNVEEGRQCANLGALICSKCHLVNYQFSKYCSPKCSSSHWSIHRRDCKNSYLKSNWQPQWVKENRAPAFVSDDPAPQAYFGAGNYLWGNVAAIDCLNLSQNEGTNATATDFKICFAASGDIRNMVNTVNNFPDDYSGECHILFNDINPLVVNRNIVILHVLLTSGDALDEAAECALHLMYSAALTPVMLAHLHRSINAIYGQNVWQGYPLPSARWRTRGRSEIQATQYFSNMRPLLQMFLSTYGLPEALKNMHDIMFNPSRVDYRDRYIASLEPSHRMAFMHYRKSGIVAPFSYDTSHFTQPNRLLYSAEGKWLTMDNAIPLNGWSIPAVKASGKRHGVNPHDIYGCLFFHVKDEFENFARRLRDFNITIHVTAFDARTLSKSIALDEFKPFGKNCFDRIETSNMADTTGIPQVLEDWGPLLNKQNKDATLLIYLMNWTLKQTNATVFSDENARVSLMRHVCSVLGITNNPNLDPGGRYSPSIIRIMESLDRFYDNSGAFREFLDKQRYKNKAKSHDIRLRSENRIHTKRMGIPLNKQYLKVPEMSRAEYYDIYCLGSAQHPLRFLEFETI